MATKKMSRQTVLITGASSKIGYELATHFAKKGYNLVLVAQNQRKLYKMADELEDEFGICASALTSDLSLPTSPDEIVGQLDNASIQIDILVNNAGFSEYGPFHKSDLQKELQMIQINLVSLTHLTKLLLPKMLKQKFGKIFNIGSTESSIPGPLNAVFYITKSYVRSFSEALSKELKGTGVNTTVLCLDAIKANFIINANTEKAK